jgi:hypothetical protein
VTSDVICESCSDSQEKIDIWMSMCAVVIFPPYSCRYGRFLFWVSNPFGFGLCQSPVEITMAVHSSISFCSTLVCA